MAFVAAAAAGLVGSLILIPLVIRFVHWRRWYDPTDHRKSHDGNVSAMGGIGIFWAFLPAAALVSWLFGLSQAGRSPWQFPAILVGAAIMHLTGVIDDLVNIRAFKKLLLQLVAASVAVAGGWVISGIAIPFLGLDIRFGVFAIPATLFWIVGISNAVNLIDGIDGFAGVVVLFACLSLGTISMASGEAPAALVAFALAGSVAGFLCFNIPPARIFMGDGGSLFLGYCVALLATVSHVQGGAMITMSVPVVLLAIPIIDTSAAILRRVKRGLPIHTPDREHFHHKLLACAGCGRRSLVVLLSVSIGLSTSAVVYTLFPFWWAEVLMFAAFFAAVGINGAVNRKWQKFHASGQSIECLCGRHGDASADGTVTLGLSSNARYNGTPTIRRDRPATDHPVTDRLG